MSYSARTALGSDMKRAFNASSFQQAANSEASWFFCSVIGLSFFETVASRSRLDSSSQHASKSIVVQIKETPRRVAQLFI